MDSIVVSYSCAVRLFGLVTVHIRANFYYGSMYSLMLRLRQFFKRFSRLLTSAPVTFL